LGLKHLFMSDKTHCKTLNKNQISVVLLYINIKYKPIDYSFRLTKSL